MSQNQKAQKPEVHKSENPEVQKPRRQKSRIQKAQKPECQKAQMLEAKKVWNPRSLKAQKSQIAQYSPKAKKSQSPKT